MMLANQFRQRFLGRTSQIAFCILFSLAAVAVLVDLYLQPKTLCQWIKIYPDGRQKSGITVETKEGRGYEGEPDDLPGLVISRWADGNEVSLGYVDASKKELSITYVNNTYQYNFKLNANYIDRDNYKWSVQVFEKTLVIRENTAKFSTVLLYDKDSKKVEKKVYLDEKHEVLWEGSTSELMPNSTWQFTRYEQGKPVFIRENVSTEEMMRLREKFSTPADKDYPAYVQETIKKWQREMASSMNLPDLTNDDFNTLSAKYFN